MYEKISAPAAIPNRIHVHNVKRLTLSESYNVLLDPSNQKQLFPEGYFCVPGFWMPYQTTNRTLRAEACRNDVTASFGPDGTTCESVAFHSLLLMKDSVTRFDVWVYGSQVNARTVLSHFLFWFEAKFNALKTAIVTFMLCFPRHVDQQEVKSHLVDVLGLPEVSDVFDTDECVMFVKNISSK